MKIYKLSNVLTIPFAITAIALLTRLFADKDDVIAMWAVVPVTIIVLIYLFQPQIDYWWLERNPIEIDPKVLKLINATNDFYRELDEEEKKEFHKRLMLYINGYAFSAKGMETDTDVPYDIRLMIAQIPVTIGFYQKDKFLKNYERIILYKHAFPSPRHKFLHTMEVHAEDGAIIFSLEHAEAAFFNPNDFYNVAWHAYVEAYLDNRKEQLVEPGEEGPAWKDLHQILDFDQSFILRTLGFDKVKIETVIVMAYFLKNNELKSVRPLWHKQLQQHFNLTST